MRHSRGLVRFFPLWLVKIDIFLQQRQVRLGLSIGLGHLQARLGRIPRRVQCRSLGYTRPIEDCYMSPCRPDYIFIPKDAYHFGPLGPTPSIGIVVEPSTLCRWLGCGLSLCTSFLGFATSLLCSILEVP